MDFKEVAMLAVEKIKSCDSMIHVISHYDADGISSAAILTSALIQLKKDFHITIVKKIYPSLIEELKKRKPNLVIFLDIGSGYLKEVSELNCQIIVADHHEFKKENYDNVIHLNPELFGIKNISGAGTTYLLVKEILDNSKLASLAIVGAMGDSAIADSKAFESPFVEKETGLKLFGRFSRPLHKAIQFSSNIPNITDESKAIQFLSEAGINAQNNGSWRTLSDLNEEETRKLSDAIVKEIGSEEVIGDVWTLKDFPDELQDAKEFATLLNACGRMGEAATGIGVCLGNEKAIGSARGFMKGYKRLISNYLRWVENNPQCIKETESARYIVAEDNIHENIIGTITSMYFRNMNDKPMIGLANAEDGIKVSARSYGMNISTIISEAAKMCEGVGGGHEKAAGCTIPLESQDKFIEVCDNLIREKLIKI
jgi:RecJ-like exonuclease